MSVEKLDLQELKDKIHAAESHGFDLVPGTTANGACGGCDVVIRQPQKQADGPCFGCDVPPHKVAKGACGGCDLLVDKKK